MPPKKSTPNKMPRATKKRAAALPKKPAGANAQTTGASRKAGTARKIGTRKTKKGLAARGTFVPVGPDATFPNLDKIEHIVVLMMENRSFDHMLGYLKLEKVSLDVDGLTKDMRNTYKGKDYFPKLRTNTAFLNKQDPCHANTCVTEQLTNNNGGFVGNYARTFPNDPEVDLVMNYYNGATLMVYDQLVNDYCICDKWFCSVDGATWPNRLYSIAGQSGGTKDNKKIPIYDLPSFVRHLSAGKIPWRWYAHRCPSRKCRPTNRHLHLRIILSISIVETWSVNVACEESELLAQNEVLSETFTIGADRRRR